MAGSPKKDDWVDISPLSIQEKEYVELESYKLDAIQKNYKLILKECNSYLDRFPNGTYKGWIAHLHPENIKLDSRLDPKTSPNNNWTKAWNKVLKDREKPSSFYERLIRRSKGKSKRSKKLRKVKKNKKNRLTKKMR